MGLARVGSDVADSRIFCLQQLLSLHVVFQQITIRQRVEVKVACRGADVSMVHVATVRGLESKRAQTTCKAEVGVFGNLDFFYQLRLGLAQVPVEQHKKRIDGKKLRMPFSETELEYLTITSFKNAKLSPSACFFGINLASKTIHLQNNYHAVRVTKCTDGKKSIECHVAC